MNSGFLNLLEHGDVVLADRGFDISDDIAIQGATRVIPCFTRGKNQMSLHEVECSHRIAKVRIHDVERVIGLLKNKYTILQSTLSISLLKCKNNTEHAFIDKLFNSLCASLINISPGIVLHL